MGLQQPYPFLGADLTPLLLGQEPSWGEERVRFSENKGNAAVLRGSWKAVFNIEPVVPSSVRLFNLKEDPGELNNRSLDEPELARQMIREYERMRARYTGLKMLFPRADETTQELDQETIQDLRNLGYIR